MRVHYGEGVANHTGPEPCAVIRKGGGEASVGDCTGQPLSREIYAKSRVPTRFSLRKATWKARYRERLKARRGRRPWHVQTLLVSGNRESSRSTARSEAAGPRREGEEP